METPLKNQIEAWYMVATGSQTPRGAIAWVADQLGVNPKSVRRWMSPDPTDNRTLSRQSKAGLRLLEQVLVLRYGRAVITAALWTRRVDREYEEGDPEAA